MAVDSSTVVTFSEFDTTTSRIFSNIYSLSYKTNLYSRIDSLTYDYAFIQASICRQDSSFTLDERYFVSGDTIPKYFFLNGQEYNTKEMYSGKSIWYMYTLTNDFTLKPMIKRYNRLKNVQTLAFDKIQILGIACVNNETESEFKLKRTNKLKQTYQIQTLIYKKNNKVKVSLQTPPRKPKFKTKKFNPGRYF